MCSISCGEGSGSIEKEINLVWLFWWQKRLVILVAKARRWFSDHRGPAQRTTGDPP
jgi:hypothetical protein